MSLDIEDIKKTTTGIKWNRSIISIFIICRCALVCKYYNF